MNHHIFSRSQRAWKTFDMETHAEIFGCEARNDTIVDGQYFHYGNCPPGEYRLGGKYNMNTQPYGPFFIEVVDIHHIWDKFGRAGIGIHGGGSCVSGWSNDRQGWCPTEGCIRMQNEDLVELTFDNYHPGDLLTVTA